MIRATRIVAIPTDAWPYGVPTWMTIQQTLLLDEATQIVGRAPDHWTWTMNNEKTRLTLLAEWRDHNA